MYIHVIFKISKNIHHWLVDDFVSLYYCSPLPRAHCHGSRGASSTRRVPPPTSTTVRPRCPSPSRATQTSTSCWVLTRLPGRPTHPRQLCPHAHPNIHTSSVCRDGQLIHCQLINSVLLTSHHLYLHVKLWLRADTNTSFAFYGVSAWKQCILCHHSDILARCSLGGC